MNKLIASSIVLAAVLLLVQSVSAAEVASCSGFEGTSDAVFFQSLTISGRDVSVYKTDSNTNICAYQTFCERKGQNWYAPLSGPEADEALVKVLAIDNYHTWILNKAPTHTGIKGVATWNGQILNDIDSPECVDGSTGEFSAIRHWGCSMCNPMLYGVSKCWDTSHVYDWILCTGDAPPADPPADNVPEFGVAAAALILTGAAGFVFMRRN